jgi:23S rRNA pseudouridine1911/1915/1917 synthase
LSERTGSWIVLPGFEKVRLDLYLIRQIAGESRSRIQMWIRKGHIRVNGKPVKTGYLTRLDDHISLQAPGPLPDEVSPEAISLDVLYEDSDLAVINKPAGLACHAGAGIRSGTLVNALLYRMGPLDTGDPARPGIVHRLDKLTSGVMLVAKNSLSHRRLAQEFKSRRVKKEYLALVYGIPSPPCGTIDLPIGRDPKNRKKMSTRARRTRTAITHYALRNNYGPVSLLGVRIETGRTHQIRVHLAHKGHPVIGDAVYGANRTRTLPAQLQSAAKELQRPFLHSFRVEFRHPQSGELLTFTAPLPAELQCFLSLLPEKR